jgi:hypothetical protein
MISALACSVGQGWRFAIGSPKTPPVVQAVQNDQMKVKINKLRQEFVVSRKFKWRFRSLRSSGHGPSMVDGPEKNWVHFTGL